MDVVAMLVLRELEGHRYHLKNILISAIIGNTLAVICLILGIRNIFLYNVISTVFIMPLMLFIAFGKKKLKGIIVQIFKLYALLTLEGGVFYMLRQVAFLRDRQVWIWSITSVLMWMISYAIDMIRRREESTYDVELRIGDQIFCMTGLYDSGNKLVDPICRGPVQIVEGGLVSNAIKDAGIPVRLIPFRALGTQDGLISAVTVDEIRIQNSSGEYAVIAPVILGLAKERLFQGREYNIILNSQTYI